jgi:hypothetical protein
MLYDFNTFMFCHHGANVTSKTITSHTMYFTVSQNISLYTSHKVLKRLNHSLKTPLYHQTFSLITRFDYYMLVCWTLIFSSPELKLKVQMNFSDRMLSVVCLSVNFSHIRLLYNHLANFNQTWHKSSLGGGDPSLFKWRGHPFTKVR